MTNPIHFVELMGIPASGKTTMAAEYASKGYTLIDTDAIRYETGYTRQNDLDEKGNEETCQRAYEALLRGENVIFDAPSVLATRKAMLGLIDLVEQKNGVPVFRELIVLRIPTSVCLDRNAKRPKPYPDEMFTRHYVNFEKGLTEIGMEGWDNIAFVYSKDVDG